MIDVASFVLFGLCVLGVAPASHGADTTGLDDFWAEVSRTVQQGDFAGYSDSYHPDAVLVSLDSRQSVPIARALASWKQGFEDTKVGKAKADVEFRLTQRLVSATTAHETGIFHYSFQPTGGAVQDSYVHFESLLVKKPEGWTMLMEFQKTAATPEEWRAAAASTQQQQ